MVRDIDRRLRGAIEHVMRYGTGAERVSRLRAASNQWHAASNDVTHHASNDLDRAA
ncbi:MAG: hypothetical protein O3B65_02450 [Chloroflexi bacterium]|nr:hypothetical protein [Chloroflexota bacterium]